MDWSEIYDELHQPPESPRFATAWTALVKHVRVWALHDLSAWRQHAVEDAVQDTCTKVVVGLDQSYGRSTFRGFVLGHYLNVRRQVVKTLTEPTVPLEPQDDPAAAPDRVPDNETLEHLRHCLNQLDPRGRRVVELRYFCDASFAKIGACLGLTEAHARIVDYRARKVLRACLEDKNHDD